MAIRFIRLPMTGLRFSRELSFGLSLFVFGVAVAGSAIQGFVRAQCPAFVGNHYCPLSGTNPCGPSTGCWQVEDECEGGVNPHYTRIISTSPWPRCFEVQEIYYLNRTCTETMVVCGTTQHFVFDDCAGLCSSSGFWSGCKATGWGSGCPNL